MKVYLIIFSLYFFQVNHCIKAQTKSEEVMIYKKNGLYGFIDSNFNKVIPAKFSYVRPFAKNGLAKVQESGLKFGFINIKGEYVIKPQFVLATSFLDNIAYIYEDNQIHIINEEGRKVKSIDKDVQEIVFVNFTLKDTILCRTKDKSEWNIPQYYNKNGLINKKGNVLIPPKYENIWADNSGNYLLEEIIKYIPNKHEYERQFSLLNTEFNTIDSTINKLIYDWHSEDVSIESVNKKGDTIVSIAPELHDLSNKRYSLIRYKRNYLDLETNPSKLVNLIHKNDISNAYPFRAYKQLIALKTEKTINKYHDDRIEIRNDSLYYYPHNQHILKDSYWKFIVITIEVLNQKGQWINPFIHKDIGKDLGGPYYQQLDTSFAYKAKIPTLKGDYRTKIRINLNTKNEKGEIVLLTSKPIDMNIPSYLLTPLSDEAIRFFIEY